MLGSSRAGAVLGLGGGLVVAFALAIVACVTDEPSAVAFDGGADADSGGLDGGPPSDGASSVDAAACNETRTPAPVVTVNPAGLLAVDGTGVYYTQGQALYWVSAPGGAPTLLHTVIGAVDALAVTNDRLVWTTDGTLHSVTPKNDPSALVVAQNSVGCTQGRLAVAGNLVHFPATSSVGNMAVDCTGDAGVSYAPATPLAVAHTSDALYFLGSAGGLTGLFGCPLASLDCRASDGGAPMVVQMSAPTDLAADSAGLAAIDGEGNIVGIPKPGAPLTVFASGQPDAKLVTLSATYIYWTTSNALYRVARGASGACVTKLVSDLAAPTDLAFSGGYVYWAATADQRIWRVPE